MTTKLVISALGEDRPGIVDELSNIIYKHSLNIEDSRMTVLGGEFAILLLVSGDQSSIDAIQTQVHEIEQALQMRLLIKVTSDSSPIENAIPYAVEVAALDHPGIVNNISSFFSERDINIVDLYGDRKAEEFVLIGQLEIPEQWDIRMLQADLEQMGSELGFAVKLQHENVFVATNQLRLTSTRQALRDYATH